LESDDFFENFDRYAAIRDDLLAPFRLGKIFVFLRKKIYAGKVF